MNKRRLFKVVFAFEMKASFSLADPVKLSANLISMTWHRLVIGSRVTLISTRPPNEGLFLLIELA